MQSNSTTSKILSTKHKKPANNEKVGYIKKLKSWKRDNAKRLPVEIY